MDDFIHGHHTEGRAAGTIDEFTHGRQGALWMTLSMDATEGWKQKVPQVVLVQLEPAGTYKHRIQVLKIYKATTQIMTTYVLHIASGLFFRIGASLSLSILNSKTVHEYFIKKKNSCRSKENKNWNQIP
jgi:hypothetical protein